MQPAPAVSLVCGDGGAWRTVGAVLAGLSAAVIALWLRGGGPAALGAGTLVAAGVWWRTAPPAQQLSWDRQCWRLQMAGRESVAGRLTVALDFGRWMLLRLDPDTGRPAHWLPISAGVAAAAWPALRSAVYSAAASPPARPAERRTD